MENAAKHVEGLSMATNEVAPTIQRLEEEWKETRVVLDRQEKVLVETYLRFLRRVAKACLEAGWRVWFRPNQWVHWGEGGFGSLSILLPTDEPEPLVDLPGEIRFFRDLSDKDRRGEEITLATVDRITYEGDRWT